MIRPASREIGPGDLTLCRAAYGGALHLTVRRASGAWSSSAACGASAWTQAELDAQLTHPPRLAGVPDARRCAMDYCVRLWPLYDRSRR